MQRYDTREAEMPARFRTVPHGSEKDRKGPVRGCVEMQPFVFLGTDYADYTDKL